MFSGIWKQNLSGGMKVMHDVNTDLLRAVARYHADGRPVDGHARHAADLAAFRRAERRAARRRAWAALWRALWPGTVGDQSCTSTVAQVSKQTPPASAITPMVARPPKPLSRPKTSTNRSDRPEETLCTSS